MYHFNTMHYRLFKFQNNIMINHSIEHFVLLYIFLGATLVSCVVR